MRNKFVIVKFGDIFIDIGCVQVVQLNVEYIYFFFLRHKNALILGWIYNTIVSFEWLIWFFVDSYL